MVIELFNLVVNNKKIIIDNDVVINDELLKTSTIRRLNNVHFNGYLDRLIDDTYELSGTLSGTMILPDDITLEDYEYNFTSSIDEKIDETRINFQKTIDITEDLWQNILVEIPLKCVNDKNKDLTLEGDGWRLISEDDVKLMFEHIEDEDYWEIGQVFFIKADREIEEFTLDNGRRRIAYEGNIPIETDCVEINTLEGIMIASKNDYIIKGIQGEFYPCKPNIFEQTYELVEQ